LQNLPTCNDNWTAEQIKECIHQTLEAAGIKMGKVMQILRVALSGKGAGPDLMISMELWGKDSVFERLKLALEKFPVL
jgi:glutamyl-tRNA synthetase